MSAEKDPWASLAETLGTSSTPEPSAPQASSPPRQPPKPRGQPKRAAPPASPSNWGSVASDLGLEVRPEVQPTHLPQSSMRPTEVAPPSSQAQAPATVVPPSISSEQGHPDSLTSRPTRNDANQDGFGSESARPPRRFDDQPRRTDSYQREPRREGDEGLPASQEVQQEPRSALDRATPRVQAAGEVGSEVDEAGAEIVAVKLVMGTAATTKAGTADRSIAAKAVGLVMAARTTATDLIIGTQAKNLLDHSNRQTMAMPMAGVRLTRPPCPVAKSLANRVARLIAAKT